MGGALSKLLKRRDARKWFTQLRGSACSRKAHYFWGSQWKASCARSVGMGHLATGMPCQDQVGTCVCGDLAMIALSDGAGSAPYSHYGAYIAVHRGMELVLRYFDEAFGGKNQRSAFARRIVKALQRDLREAALLGINLTDKERERNNEASRGEALLVPCTIKDLACTLLLVAVKRNRFLILHTGDGVVGIEYAQWSRRWLEVASEPTNGAFANETQFVTGVAAEENTRLITGSINKGAREVVGFIAMSDGPEMALYAKKDRLIARSCQKLFDANRRYTTEVMNSKLLGTIRNSIQKKTSDDCSIALMTSR